MFDFFEGLIEKLGVKLISDFSNKLFKFITEIKKNSTGDNNDNGERDAQIGSSGYFAQIGSSGGSAKIGSSGDYAKIGSSGYYAQIGSSGDSAQIGSSGDSAQIGSSGDSAQIGSSGYSAQIGSSGGSAQIGSSGGSAQIGSSGDSAKIGSSGDFAQIGSSGDSAKIGSSGDYAKIGSSGDSAQIGSSGYSAQISSSGDYAKIDISGKDSIGFACGCKTIIKAKKGTWISLAEYKRVDIQNGYKIIPKFALSAQIGNKDYKDYKNRILKEDTYYCLYNKKFHPVEVFDDITTIETGRKVRDGITIIKAVDMDDIYDKEVKEMYVAVEGELSAHGYTLREAIDDLTFKKMKNVNIDEIVSEIKKTRKVTRSQYRAITGACSYGTNKFCEEHKIEELEEIDLEELRKILVNDYGAKRFWNLIDKE